MELIIAYRFIYQTNNTLLARFDINVPKRSFADSNSPSRKALKFSDAEICDTSIINLVTIKKTFNVKMKIKTFNNFNNPTFWSLFFCGAVALNIFSYRALDYIFGLSFLIGILCLKSDPIRFRPKFFLSKNTFNVLIALFLICSSIGYFSGNLNSINWDDIWDLRWILGLYMSYYAGLKLKLSSGKIQQFTLIVLSAALYLLIDYFIDFRGQIFSPAFRLQGLYANPNHLAHTILLIFAFYLGHLYNSNNEKLKFSVATLYTVIALGIAILATYSRSAWLGAAAAFITFVILAKNKYIYYTALGMLLLVGTVFLTNTFGVSDRIIYSIDISAAGAQGTRLIAWKVNWNIFVDNPIFGVGIENARSLYPAYYEQLHVPKGTLILGNAHNQFLQLLSGTGITGFILYLIIFSIGSKYFYTSFKNRTLDEEKKIALGSLLVIVALMFSSLTDTPFRLHECRNYILLILGFSFGYLSHVPTKTDEKEKLFPRKFQ
ncbi:O-antigen ligase family protein [Bdellovibrio bacteriovorus]